jgi:transcriptional regulator NrdR family protein
MVCVYCSSATWVLNSRLQALTNSTWRRRACKECKQLFTTLEIPDLEKSFVVKSASGELEAFSRDHLFISLYESCKHRPNALQDATNLTQTVLRKTLQQAQDGVIERELIVSAALGTLSQFDHVAKSLYEAYHT